MGDAATKSLEIELAWAQHNQRGLGAGLKTALRRRLAGEQGWRCCYCRCRMSDVGRMGDVATLEHVTPRSHGGSDDESNLVVACWDCNVARGNDLDFVERLLADG
jgi:5-methylcytosine-specific restriction protein A